MLAAIHSASLFGIEALPVTVEVEVAQGLPHWTIVGMPAATVRESQERVCSALVNSGFHLPKRRIVINLAPADQKKEGTAFDLPIAIGTLIATGQLSPTPTQSHLFAGELGLDGSLRQIRGALSIARYAAQYKNEFTLVIPSPNLREAGRVTSIRIAAPTTLTELVQQLRNGALQQAVLPPTTLTPTTNNADFSDVIGQLGAKRALEVAAAGSHNVLLNGPPGAGKTLLARRVPTILPILTDEEALDVIAIHSIAGLLPSDTTTYARPFRAPHHTISGAGLIGGGRIPRPGEVSLAHHGVLFLDEMLEFPRAILESIRQPLEDGHVVIARAAGATRFPAQFTLIGAANPCPCGYAGTLHRVCVCGSPEIARYRARLSGPLADRIDMHVNVEPVPLAHLSASSSLPSAESSISIRDRVTRARATQRTRYVRHQGVTTNAHAQGRWLETHTPIAPDSRRLLHDAANSIQLSARAYHRVLKVARTIADLEGDRSIEVPHISEALRYRPRPNGR